MPVIKVEYAEEVKATAERLWDILIDIKSWPDRKLITYTKPFPPGQINEGSDGISL